MKCVGCAGRGCSNCDGGYVMIDRCPLKLIDGPVHTLMRFAEYARESSMWPVSGGALDQNPAFLEAESMIRSERRAWNVHLGLD